MALKFLNKKGWHTGSLRNIENVWKAEQKHNAEQAKLEELRKQIQEEREKSEFRQLQEQAGLVPRQERLDFLYESGLAVGKSSEGFKALEAPQAPTAAASASAEAGSSKAAVPGALFEDKPQSANDTWRKLHSDPLLLIRQREQDALARIKNNPVQMAMIRKSVEAEKKHKDDKGKREKKKHKRKRHHKLKSDSENTSGSEEDRSEEDRTKRNRPTSYAQKHSKRKHSSKDSTDDEERRKSDHIASERRKDSSSKHEKRSSRVRSDSRYSSESEDDRRKSHKESNLKHERHSSRARSDARYSSESEEDRRRGGHSTSDHPRQNSHARYPSRLPERDEERRKYVPSSSEHHHPISEPADGNNKNKEARMQSQQGPGYNRRKVVPKMTEEEREARLREMQLDAELHEEQRWKRIKKAAEADAREAVKGSSSGGKNFLEDAQKSIYGTEKGGSTTIEESVRRRAYYSQGGTAAHESNAFRR